MPQSASVNRRIVLNARPRGAPTARDFRIETGPVPEPKAGQVLLRTLSLTPMANPAPVFARVAATMDRRKRARFSRLPPHSSCRRLTLGLRNWETR